MSVTEYLKCVGVRHRTASIYAHKGRVGASNTVSARLLVQEKGDGEPSPSCCTEGWRVLLAPQGPPPLSRPVPLAALEGVNFHIRKRRSFFASAAKWMIDSPSECFGGHLAQSHAFYRGDGFVRKIEFDFHAGLAKGRPTGRPIDLLG